MLPLHFGRGRFTENLKSHLILLGVILGKFQLATPTEELVECEHSRVRKSILEVKSRPRQERDTIGPPLITNHTSFSEHSATNNLKNTEELHVSL